MKRSSSAAKARLTPPGEKSDKASGPPMETIEIAVGPNADGHTDQVVSAHKLDAESGAGDTVEG